MLTLTILCVSMFQMSMVALAPVISAMTEAFPGISALTAQMATTFLNLILVIVALLSGAISRRIGRRWMAAIAMGLYTVVGLCAPFLSSALWAVFLWSALLGAGTGLFVPAMSSLMVDCYQDDERQKIAGFQTACVNLGGVVLSLLSGSLAAIRWDRAYLVFLLALPVLLLCLKYLPRDTPGKSHSSGGGTPSGRSHIPGAVWLAALQTTLFAILYFAFSTNISLFLTEKGYASTSLSGVATASFMLGGCICGLLFTKVLHLLGKRTAAGAFLLLAVSYLIIYLFDGIVPLLLAAVIGGGSLSFIFPYFLVTIANRVDPSISVISTSLILSVGPNLGSFVSPMILTNLTSLFAGEAAAPRFLLAAVLAVVGAAVLFAVSCRRGRE